jgi:hypothetical protein
MLISCLFIIENLDFNTNVERIVLYWNSLSIHEIGPLEPHSLTRQGQNDEWHSIENAIQSLKSLKRFLRLTRMSKNNFSYRNGQYLLAFIGLTWFSIKWSTTYFSINFQLSTKWFLMFWVIPKLPLSALWVSKKN